MTLRQLEPAFTEYRCGKCGLTKPRAAFSVNSTKKRGVQYWCKECHLAHARANADTLNEQARGQYQTNPRHRARVLARRRKLLYGIEPEEVEAMREAQGNACALCGTREPGGRGDFHVDHDHQTEQVRGLLCQQCNWSLGVVEKWYLPQIERVENYRAKATGSGLL